MWQKRAASAATHLCKHLLAQSAAAESAAAAAPSWTRILIPAAAPLARRRNKMKKSLTILSINYPLSIFNFTLRAYARARPRRRFEAKKQAITKNVCKNSSRVTCPLIGKKADSRRLLSLAKVMKRVTAATAVAPLRTYFLNSRGRNRIRREEVSGFRYPSRNVKKSSLSITSAERRF